MEDITDANYLHAEEVCKGFEPKDIGEYHDFHGQICFSWCILKLSEYVSQNI